MGSGSSSPSSSIRAGDARGNLEVRMLPPPPTAVKMLLLALLLLALDPELAEGKSIGAVDEEADIDADAAAARSWSEAR